VAREIVDGRVRRQLVSERREGNHEVDGTPDGRTQGAIGRPGICGGREHVFAKLEGQSDGPRANGCSYPYSRPIWLSRAKIRPCGLHGILHRPGQSRASG
jgi:hypothetical protein